MADAPDIVSRIAAAWHVATGRVRKADERPSRPSPRQESEADTDGYSLADISPEAAAQILLVELMQQVPRTVPGSIGLEDLKQALEKIRDGYALTEADREVLAYAGAIVGSLRRDITTTSGEAAYQAEEIDRRIAEFNRVALPHATRLSSIHA